MKLFPQGNGKNTVLRRNVPMEHDQEAWRNDPRWLSLAPDKQIVALARMDAVTHYLDGARSAANAAAHAAGLNIGQSRFYGLCQAWREAGTPLVLAPYRDPVVPQHPSVRRERAAEILKKVTAALSGTRDRTPGAIVAAVAGSWGAGTPSPSRETLRRFVEREIARQDTTASDTLRREGNEVARTFGEVLVVDHVLVDLFTSDAAPPQRPFLSLAIDLFTGAPVGHGLSLERPSPEAVMVALLKAARSSANFANAPIRPRIVLNSAYGPEWSALIDSIKDAGLVLNGRRSPNLSFGSPTARLLGMRLARVRLLPRAGHDPLGTTAGYDPARHPILTLDQARDVVWASAEQAVAAMTTRVKTRPIDLSSLKGITATA